MFTLAGCISDDQGTDSTGAADSQEAEQLQSADSGDFNWTGLNQSYPYNALEEFCPDAESCDYWDGQYHEGAVYVMDTLIVDAVVLPVPGASIDATETAGQATAAWALVEEFTESWFTDAWQLNTYVVGDDIPSADYVTDPEVLVISESGQRSTSIGLNAEQLACTVLNAMDISELDENFVSGSLATKVYPVHEHHGMAIFAAECVTGGFRCVALNFSGALGGNNALYDLVAHEVGHCIGLSHVGDALDFNSRFVPTPDIMAYADNPSRVSCPSTLNARAMEGIYAHLADEPIPSWITEDQRTGVNPWEYKTVDCPLPPASVL
jgi:hypothetical protein